jgi:hypothetical protein
MDGLISWLRSTIEGDLAAAKAADEASPGPWVNTGQDGHGDAWQIHGGPSEELKPDWDAPGVPLKPVPIRVATLQYDDGGGVWEREAADHIVLQQPRDTIARCEAELSVLDLFEKQGFALGGAYFGALHDAVNRLARGYRHRGGYPGESDPDAVSE